MLLSKIKSKESGRHYMAKKLLFEWLEDRDVTFISHNGKDTISFSNWDFMSMEAYTGKNSTFLGHCFNPIDENCFRCESENNYLQSSEPNTYYPTKEEKYIHGAYNKNISILNDDIETHYSHPCNFCKYRSNLDVGFIFDIAMSREGIYKTAIEIVYTSPVKRNKIEFCKRHHIKLISLYYKDILWSRLPPRTFYATVLT